MKIRFISTMKDKEYYYILRRPLLWAIVWFALGEVIAINISNEQQAGVLFCMLACCVLWRKRIWLMVAVISFFVGFVIVHIHHEDFRYRGMKISEYGYVKNIDEREGEGDIDYNITVEIKSEGDNETYRALIYGCDEPYKLGSRVRVSGRLDIFETARNPGVFDMQTFYLAKGITYCMYNAEVTAVSQRYDKLRQLLYEVRQKGCENLELLVDDEVAGLYQGILLGEKDNIDEYTKLIYQITSLMHILSLSGLHLSLISALVYRALKRITGTIYIASPVTMCILYMYGVMTGFSVATIRAFIMMFIAMLGELIGRDYDMLTADGITLLVLLLANPYRVYDGGMWLSVGAVAGVFLGRELYKRVKKGIHIDRGRIKRYIIESLLMSVFIALGINIVTMPIILWQFYQFCPYSLLVNLLVLPLMPVVVVCGLVALIIISCITGNAFYLAGNIIKAGAAVLKLYNAVCSGTIKLPGYVINTGKPDVWQLVIYYAAVGVLYMMITGRQSLPEKWQVLFSKRKILKVKCFIAAVTVVASTILIAAIDIANNKERAVFFDVGQGDAIAIRTKGGTNICVDGGSTSSEKVGRYILIPALKSMRMAHIDYWFITHTDEDHIDGLVEILQLGRLSGLDVDNIVFAASIERDESYEELCRLAGLNDIHIIHMNYMDRLEGDFFELICYHPVAAKTDYAKTEAAKTDYAKTEAAMTGDAKTAAAKTEDAMTVWKNYDKNQASLALVYKSEDIEIMLLGDMDSVSIEDMLTETDIADDFNSCDARYKIIKVPHHGSKYSACTRLYEEISFDVAVISCGENNRYGHPHREVMDCLKQYDLKYYRTDENGAVIF